MNQQWDFLHQKLKCLEKQVLMDFLFLIYFLLLNLEMYKSGSWCILVSNQRFIVICHHFFLYGIFIVSNQRFMVVYYGLSLIAARDSLLIQR